MCTEKRETICFILPRVYRHSFSWTYKLKATVWISINILTCKKQSDNELTRLMIINIYFIASSLYFLFHLDLFWRIYQMKFFTKYLNILILIMFMKDSWILTNDFKISFSIQLFQLKSIFQQYRNQVLNITIRIWLFQTNIESIYFVYQIHLPLISSFRHHV
jgi:hypothetical protein